MRIVCLLLLLSGSGILLGGCWDRVEVNDLAIVTAATIDRGEQERVKLSVQVFLPKTISSGGGEDKGGGSGKATTLIGTHEGSSISDALSKLQANLARRIFWGQCRVFVFSEEIAREGIEDHLDFLLRHPQIRDRAYVFVSKEEARQTIDFQSQLERHSGEVIKELTRLNIGAQTTIQELDEMITEGGRAAVVPYLVTKKPEEKNKPPAYPEGSAVFKEDRMVGVLTEKETRGVLWLSDEVKGYTVTVEGGNEGELALNPVSAKTRMIPSIQNGRWRMTFRVVTEGAAIQNNTKWDLEDKQSVIEADQVFQQSVKARIEAVVRKLQHELNADVVNIGEEFHRKYPQQWKQIERERRWDEKFQEVEIVIEVEAHINRQGMINESPEKQLEEVRVK